MRFDCDRLTMVPFDIGMRLDIWELLARVRVVSWFLIGWILDVDLGSFVGGMGMCRYEFV